MASRKGIDSTALAFGDTLRGIRDWWNTKTTVTFCGVACAKVGEGYADSPFGPKENTASNGQRVIGVAGVVTTIAPASLSAKAAPVVVYIQGTGFGGRFSMNGATVEF